METKIKKLGKLSLGLVLALGLVGCGSDKNVSEEASPEAANITKDTDIPTSKVKDSGQDVSKVPDFEAEDQKGDKFSQDIFKDYDATVINYWFTGCSACIAEMEDLNKISDDIKADKKVNFISICTDADYDESTKKAYEDIVSKYNPTYSALKVKREGPMKDYLDKIFTYPTTIVVDKNGNIIGSEIPGTINNDKALKKINENIGLAKESSNN